MVWQRPAKPPGASLCKFDSCRLRVRVRGVRQSVMATVLKTVAQRALESSTLSLSAALFGPVAQMESERRFAKPEGAGSSPARPT